MYVCMYACMHLQVLPAAHTAVRRGAGSVAPQQRPHHLHFLHALRSQGIP